VITEKVILISLSTSKSSKDVIYSFVFDETYRLAKRGFEIHVARGFFADEDGDFWYVLLWVRA